MVARERVEQLLVAIDVEGGLFRIFPDGRAREIDNEDDLRDIETILALEPIDGHADRIRGGALELIAWQVCRECDGTGVYRGVCVCREDFDEDLGHRTLSVERPWHPSDPVRWPEFVDDQEHECGCVECRETGLVYTYTDRRILRLALPSVGAVPAPEAVALGGVA